ncbi:MAG TPA: small, acid-soluble spore protein, alpha/beta type [Bacillota bacterium]|nr:small, acid-soluble spore protein, alpha/beta type [Bacillota bacterium]
MGVIKQSKLRVEKEDMIKYEIAEELGLLDKVKESGWGSLSTKETGRIGGLVAVKRQRDNIKATKEKKPPT